ncbi:MAG: 50S ribosomal protein L18 [Sulfuriferula multivorans]|uniref:Large ribosomal subunit protein uL18 n=1 Tax=Sulfuriferula multivorans TaxID=1559896 RepID=A0A7C9K9F9_9PROT|nr:50S ribosomal protein L18 [Sulfuriferula multivorans]
MNTKQSRIRRARKTRAKIAAVKAIRLAILRTNTHIYAQIISADGGTVIASASTNDKEMRSLVPNGGNVAAATAVGKRLAEKAKGLGIEKVAFDRAGFKFHGRVKALAESAREGGLVF